MPDHMPIARARSRGSGKVLVRIDSVLGSMKAPPTPCTVRAAIRNDVEGARAHSTEPPVNRARPPMNALRRPNRSPSVPPVSSRLASASTKASTIHCRPVRLAPSPAGGGFWMVGSARFTTVLSSITMNRAKHMHARVRRCFLRSASVMDPLLLVPPYVCGAGFDAGGAGFGAGGAGSLFSPLTNAQSRRRCCLRRRAAVAGRWRCSSVARPWASAQAP